MNVERAPLDFFGWVNGPTLSAKSKTALYDSWTPQHQNATAPIEEAVANFSTNGPPSSYFLEDGSYFKCKVLTLGYRLSKNTLQKLK
jgi:hypothetical protein